MDFHGINNTRADGGSQGQSSPPCLHIIRFCPIDLSACRLIAYPLNSHLNHCLVLFPPLSFGRPHFPNCMNWYPGAVAARAHHYISASTSPPIDSSESDSQIQSPILLNSSQSPPLSDPRFHGRSHPPPLPLQVWFLWWFLHLFRSSVVVLFFLLTFFVFHFTCWRDADFWLPGIGCRGMTPLEMMIPADS